MSVSSVVPKHGQVAFGGWTVSNIRAGGPRSKIQFLWAKIKDYLCNTQYEQALELLTIALHKPDKAAAAAMCRLGGMLSDSCPVKVRIERGIDNSGAGKLVFSMSLDGTDFCQVPMEPDLCGLDMRGGNLAGLDLKGVDLTGAKLENANLKGATLIGAILEGANLKGADLRDVNFENVRMKKANLDRAHFNVSAFASLVQGARDVADVTLYEFETCLSDPNPDSSQSQNEKARIQELTREAQQRTSMKFTAGPNKDIEAGGLRSSKEWAQIKDHLCITQHEEALQLLTTAVRKPDKAAAAAVCRLGGMLSGTCPVEVRIERGRDSSGADKLIFSMLLDGTAFCEIPTGLDLRGLDLRGGNLGGLDLTGAELEDADLRNAILTGATLENAKLKDADLRGANFHGVRMKDANLDGARFDLSAFTSLVRTAKDLTGVTLHGFKAWVPDPVRESSKYEREKSEFQRALLLASGFTPIKLTAEPDKQCHFYSSAE